MEIVNRLSKTTVRNMALNLRMMRLLGHRSLESLEMLLEHGRIHCYGSGDIIPISGDDQYCHLLILKGEVLVLESRPGSENCEPVDIRKFKARDAVYVYIPPREEPDCEVTIIALSRMRCLQVDAGLMDWKPEINRPH